MGKIKTITQGWECPRCHRINAPHIDACPCNRDYVSQQPPIVYIPWTTNPYWQIIPPYIITCEITNNTGLHDSFSFWSNQDDAAYDKL